MGEEPFNCKFGTSVDIFIYRIFLNRSRGFYYLQYGKNAAYNQRRLVFKGDFYYFGCNGKEVEVEILMI